MSALEARRAGDVDDEYNEDEDEDFNPDLPTADADDVSSDSDDEEAPSGTKRKHTDASALHEAELDSGDEATIKQSKRKKRKGGDVDDDEGGEGGLIKTRAQRKLEQKEKKALATSKGASVDVNALWASMSAKPASPAPAVPSEAQDANGDGVPQDVTKKPTEGVKTGTSEQPQEAEVRTTTTTSAPRPDDEQMITIKRTYEFAGEQKTETKTVPISSAEAKLYLAEQAQAKAAASSTSTSAPKPGLRRPKKRASMFGNGSSAALEDAKGKKLTTLEKSKLDWAAHVDQEGISEELEEAKRGKGEYLGRMDFLARMDGKREEEAKAQRATGRKE